MTLLLFILAIGRHSDWNRVMSLFIRFAAPSALLLVSSLAWSGGFTAKGFEIRGPRERPIFTMEQTFGADGLSSYSAFRSPEGKDLVTEKMEFDDAGAPLRYTVDHLQSGTSGVVEVKNGRLTFVHRTADGKVKTNDEIIPDVWATGPMFLPMVRKNWDRLMKGEPMKFRFAVWDRAETVGFQLFKERVEKKPDGREVVILKMKPTAFIIAAIVDPLYFEMRPDGSFLETMTGRTLPKRQDGSKLKDLDAYIVYSAK
jgi:hypothetical protein